MSIPKTGDLIARVEMCKISREQLRLYSDASGDPNRIHLEDAAAKKSGLPGVIAHGMLIASLVGLRAEDWVKESCPKDWKISNIVTRFKAMTFPDEIISVAGVVRKTDESSVFFELKALNPKDEVKVLCRVTATGG